VQFRNQIKKLVFLFLGMLWTCATYAAVVAAEGAEERISAIELALSILVALIGGAAHTASRIADPEITIKSVRLEVTKDLLTSVVAALLFFFGGIYYEWPISLRFGAITLAAYGGSRVLEPGVAALGEFMKRLGLKGS
jgi:hypothetical protein